MDESNLWLITLRLVSATPTPWLDELTEGTRGFVLGDRNYWSPDTKAELEKPEVELVAPYRHKSRDPHPKLSAYLSRLRYRIDTVFGQLTDRYSIKRLWVRDWWHLANKLLRTVLQQLSEQLSRASGARHQ